MKQTTKGATISAYLINPSTQSIEAVTLTREPDALSEIYRLLQCSIITSVELRNGATVYVDDEGLLNAPKAFFSVTGFPQPLAGRGLVVGTNGDGEDIDAPCGLDDLKADVSYILPYVASFWGRYPARATPGARIVELMPFAAMVSAIEREAQTVNALASETTTNAGEVVHG